MKLSKNILNTLLIIMTAFGLIFFCKAVAHIFLEDQTHHESISSEEEANNAIAETDCCNLSDHPSIQDHFVVATIPQLFDLNISFFFLTSAFLVLFLGVYRYLDSFLYFLNIRQRFGSFSVFNPFLQYFRTGILNPKIF